MRKLHRCPTCTCSPSDELTDEFIRTHLIRHKDSTARTHAIHTAYMAWMYERHDQNWVTRVALTQTSLTRYLKASGFTVVKRSENHVIGYRLR